MGNQITGSIDRQPERHVLNAKDLGWLISEYLNDCRARLEEPKTVVEYECKLRWFVKWWGVEGPKRGWILREADCVQFERDLRAVTSGRTKRSLSWNSRKDVLRRLREALHWAYRQGYTDRDYASWIPKAHGSPRKRKAATLPMLGQLFDASSQSYVAPRDRAIMAMLIGMGLRRGELANLDVGDLHFEADRSGYANLTGKRTVAKPEGKREAAFDAATGKILANYLLAHELGHGPLFRGRSGERLTPQGVYKVIKRIIAAAGLADQIDGPHDLRRAFATVVAREGSGKTSGKLLSEQLGHVSSSTTDIYVLPSTDDIRRALVSPMSMIAASTNNQDAFEDVSIGQIGRAHKLPIIEKKEDPSAKAQPSTIKKSRVVHWMGRSIRSS
jgi:integrase